MRIDVYFTAAEVDHAVVQQKTAVVIDVLRATSTMVEALANGAKAIYPTLATEDAIKLATSIGREDTLLCGERKGVKIEGYDLGNSPLEFTPERVEGKRLIMNTTNGTRAFLAAAGADRVVAASFLNLSAVAEAILDAKHLAIVCSGKEDLFSFEDGVCAGRLIARLEERLDAPPELNDAAMAARALARSVSVDASFLRETAAGRALVDIGMEEDLPRCAEVDRHAIVPEMHDRMIRA